MKNLKFLTLYFFIILSVFFHVDISGAEARAKRVLLPTLQIGINYLNSDMRLKNCINDVDHVKNILLIDGLHARQNKFRIMTDLAKGKNYPTGKNIRNQIEFFTRRVNQLGRGFFQYSGHGSYVRDNSGDEKDGYDEVLVPADVYQKGVIKDDEIFNNLIRKLKKNVRLTMLVDSCNSGTVSDLPYKWDLNGKYEVQKKLPKRVLKSLPHVIMISGCKDNEYSYDGGRISGEKNGAGAMTAAFLTTVRAYNFKLNYGQLLKGMHQILSRGGFKQTPQLSSTRIIKLTDPVEIGGLKLQ